MANALALWTWGFSSLRSSLHTRTLQCILFHNYFYLSFILQFSMQTTLETMLSILDHSILSLRVSLYLTRLRYFQVNSIMTFLKLAFERKQLLLYFSSSNNDICICSFIRTAEIAYPAALDLSKGKVCSFWTHGRICFWIWKYIRRSKGSRAFLLLWIYTTPFAWS